MGKQELKKKVISTLCRSFKFAGRLQAGRIIKKHTASFLTNHEVELCERNPELKKETVDRFFRTWPNRFSNDRAMAEKLVVSMNELGPKDKEAVKTELLFARIGYGFHPEECVCYELIGKPASVRDTFISSKDCVTAIFRMNDYSEMQVFNNKGKTYQRFGSYYQRDAVYLANDLDYRKFLEFIKKHPVFVKKAVYEAMGRSVELLDVAACGHTEKQLFDSLISHGPHILEEQVFQSEYTKKLNSSSVNTIRCITFNTKHGLIAPYFFMKVGRAGSFVDNGGAGGILVGIDGQTGRLDTDGFDEYNRRYVSHPDSGVTLKGYQLPAWGQMKNICFEMSAQIPKVRYIGWDMAHTDKGWVVIEGNGMSQMIGPQTVYKRGCKAEVEAFMADMDLII